MGKKTDLRRWNVLENLISKWENPSLGELHRLARDEKEKLNHVKNANSQWISESRKTPLIRKKRSKTSFQKQRYILSGKPKEDGNEVSDCNKKVIYQFHHFLQKKKENGSEF